MLLEKNAKVVLERFLKKDEKGNPEKPEELLKRVAKDCAMIDLRYHISDKRIKETEKEFFEAMNNLEFLPNLPLLANTGRELQQLAACFVLPIEDNIESIFQAVKNMAVIQKSGGGTGFDFSKLRPEGFNVRETQGTASGPVSFMKVFDSATGAIKEGGIRRGANMGILRIDHPDIEKFISCKQNMSLENFNISVAITDNFMEAVIKNKDFILSFNNKEHKKVKARILFELLCKNAWQTGDPGIIFIDEINRHNTLPQLGKLESTNPCAEMPLFPYESCILGSINLTKFIKKNLKIDFDRLEKTVKTGVHFLDNSIDASSYPLREIERIVKANRKIGLGVMGFADMLILMKIPYDSIKAEKLAEKIMKFIKEKAEEASREIAYQKGNFPNHSKSIFKESRRNATLTSIAPTGTIAIFAGCSAGIEPLFNVIFKRNTAYGEFYEINPFFKNQIKKFKIKKEDMQKINSEGSIQNTTLPQNLKKIFKTAYDISPEYHLKIQSGFQKYTDNGISKTINLPESSSVEDIKRIFLEAYKQRVKGITVYRYNSKKKQVLEFCNSCV